MNRIVFVSILAITTGSALPQTQARAIPTCGTELLSEDFESCNAGTWIGNCNGWLTWANGSNHSDFYISDAQSVSGTRSLHVAGSGSCWESGHIRSSYG